MSTGAQTIFCTSLTANAVLVVARIQLLPNANYVDTKLDFIKGKGVILYTHEIHYPSFFDVRLSASFQL